MMACNAFPDQVQSLCMIDSLHPMTRQPEEGPAMLAHAMRQITRWDADREKVFACLEDAVRARLAASPFTQTPDSAQLIMRQATQKTAQGYRLLSDARLNVRSPIMLSRPQLEPFIKNVRQPVLAILGRDGLIKTRQGTLDSVKLFENIQVKILDGGHHLHMEQPREVAMTYLKFLQKHL